MVDDDGTGVWADPELLHECEERKRRDRQEKRIEAQPSRLPQVTDSIIFGGISGAQVTGRIRGVAGCRPMPTRERSGNIFPESAP